MVPKNDSKDKTKQKIQGVGSLSFTANDISILNDISSNFLTKTKEYSLVSNVINNVIANSTQIVSQCNYISKLITFMDENKDTKFLLNTEFAKLKNKTACKNQDYVVSITSHPGSKIGELQCADSETPCTSRISEIDVTKTHSNLVFGCSKGKRFALAFSQNQYLGNYFEFSSNELKTCNPGVASNCAKNIKSLLSPKSLRFMQGSDATSATNNTSNQCLFNMKKTCSDILNRECSKSELYQFIGDMAPSSTGSPLPDKCKDIDIANPDYTECFKWINSNLIKFSLFPNLKAIMNIQETITKSQVVPLRMLQTSNGDVKIVKTDASVSDKEANIPAETYTIPAEIMQIDGSTPTSSADASVQANTVVDVSNTENTNTDSTKNFSSNSYFNKINLFNISLVLIFMFI